MRAYTTREAAELLGISPSQIRSFARQQFVLPIRAARGHFRFSFQDLVLLRTAKELVLAGLDSRRICRALRALQDQLPTGRPLSSVKVLAQADQVLVREHNTVWEAESGQTILDFKIDELAEKVAPLVKASGPIARQQANTSDEWFEVALEFDQVGEKEDALAAYRETLSLDSTHVNARINLGRLLHNERSYQQAENLYREALKIDPTNSIAAFNLGVVLEDQSSIHEAIELYLHTLTLDPELPDVHYNLARLYENQGNQKAAIRHFSKFKLLSGYRDNNT
ncbi:MAG: tetratricopeptide repeat protein [Gammaproteobacteria bacterium]|nr:tetratricopeptide repeat protein [Gammaproteobacteria bacterium]